jgi:dTDP-glucose pyrophosphorylase
MTDRFQASVVSDGVTIRDAMVALERAASEIALAVDPTGRLTGVVTDGDIRRALLGGAHLDDPVRAIARPDFVAVDRRAGRAEVLDLMHARRISQIPVIDGDGRPIGLHLLHDMLGSTARRNWAVVMAGGRGERLMPLTDDIPKPMLKVAGRPILERIVLHLVGHGIREIYLSIHYLADVIERHFGDGAAFGCDIRYLREDEPRGTAGALALLPAIPDEPVVVMNGDLLTQFDVGDMIDRHQDSHAVMTIGVARYLHQVPFGCLEVDADGGVVSIEEKPTMARTINSGIYVIDPSVLARVPRDRPSTLPALVEDTLERGGLVRAYDIDDDWLDIGRREELARARGAI